MNAPAWAARTLAALTISATALSGGALTARADSTPASEPTARISTAAKAFATHDGQRQARFAYTVRTTDGARVEAQNLAHARASCRRCTAVAVSVQIVVAGHVRRISDPPDPAHPLVLVSNLAVAENIPAGTSSRSTAQRRGVAGCTRCATMALAYQFVIIGQHRLALTPAAERQLAQTIGELRAVVLSGADHATIKARADVLTARIERILDAGVVLSPHD